MQLKAKYYTTLHYCDNCTFLAMPCENMLFAYAQTKVQTNCATKIRSTIPLFNPKFLIFRSCTARFVSDWVGNPEDRFSHDSFLCVSEHYGRSVVFPEMGSI